MNGGFFLSKAYSLCRGACFLGGLAGVVWAAPVEGVLLHPRISPDGTRVAFTWRGDVWSAPAQGGQARRLTTHPARDGEAEWSPDGGRLVFTSHRDGPRHLYSMAARGGAVTRHSHHSEGLRLETLTPDGRAAVVRALRDHPGYEARRLFRIPLDPDAAGEELVADLDLHSPSIHPTDGRMLLCRGGEVPYRKGYRGGRSSSIWLHDPAVGGFEKIIQEQTGARQPRWHADGGSFYYLSERCGTWNLWWRKAGEKDRRITRFEGEGILDYSLSADGRRAVFTRGFGLWSMELADGAEPAPLALHHAGEVILPTEEVREIRQARDADFSASGLELVFSAEGRIFAMDTLLREPNPLTHGPAWHESPRFTADGRSVIAIEESGLQRRLVRLDRATAGDFWWKTREVTQVVLAGDDCPVESFELAEDGKSLLYVNTRGVLARLPVEGGEATVIHQGWEPFEFSVSPDGRWIAAALRDADFNRDICLIAADGSGAVHNLSRHPGPEWSPQWSPDGRKLAFLGQRRPGETRIHWLHLSLAEHHRTLRERQREEAEVRMGKDPWYREQNEAAEEPATAATEPQEQPPPDAKQPKPAGLDDKKPAFRIDLEDIHERILTLDTGSAVPSRVMWSADSKEIHYQASGGEAVTYRVEPGATSKPRTLMTHRGQPIRLESATVSYWLIEGEPALWKNGTVTRYSPRTEIIRNRNEHLGLGFQLAWRWIRDRFYDPALNGLDWEEIRRKYQPHAESAVDSEEFALVLQRMFGELNASHLGLAPATWPSAPSSASSVSRLQRTRHTGLRFEHDASGMPRVSAVIPGSPAALAQPEILPGDRLIEVNDSPLAAGECLIRRFNGRLTDPLRLTFTREGGETPPLRHELRAISFEQARELARLEEIRASRRHVEQRSEGRLGYVHIARMYQENFDAFHHQLAAAGHGRDGLVIDIRDNRGGFIADHLLTILCQPRHAFTISRGGGIGHAGERTIYASWDKPVILITNANSYSNAEVFAHAIQHIGRGKVVGMPTHGGVISTTRRSLLDLGTINIPFRGWFLPENGADMELGPALPDVRVDNTPDEILAGRDRQLDTAIDLLAAEAREWTAKPAVAPVYRSQSPAPPER
jgi:tricorn protease